MAYKAHSVIIALASTVFFSRAQSWSQLSALPGTERDDGVAEVIGAVAYFGTGLRAGTGLGGDFYALDLSNNAWSVIASMPAGSERQYAISFAYGNYLFVQGGQVNGGGLTNSMYRYDVAANTWSLMAPKPGSPVSAASSFVIDDKAYLVSGKFQDNTVSDEVWEYNITMNAWAQKNNLSFGGRWRGNGAAMNNYGYFFFGVDNAGRFRKEMYRYIAANDSWTKVADFPYRARNYAAMETIGDKLVIFSGIDTTQYIYKDVWFFTESGGFASGPALPSFSRKGGMACATADKFYYSCGVTQSARVKETWMLSVPVGLEELDVDDPFSFFPNPITDKLFFRAYEDGALVLCDLPGKEIMQLKIKAGVQEVCFSELEKGVYVFRLITSRGTVTRRLVKN